jgi:hypothetical protein
MPSFLEFDTTRVFRDFIIGRTLQQPNGPHTFTASNYSLHTLSDFPNVDPGDVETNRAQDLLLIQNSNTYKPLQYLIMDSITTFPRRANLSLYPYFKREDHSLVGIMSTANFDTESELFKFAANYIKEDREGPVHARIAQNLYSSTVGRVRLFDAMDGNTSTALNLLTGREPLIESDYHITVGKTLPGKGVDFIKQVSGVELPFSTIPGDYLSNPSNPVNFRPESSTEAGKILQDVTGAIGSLVGIPRRPKLDRKPSDLLIEHMGSGQKKALYHLLSFSKYAPNYSLSARSQNSSKVFNFVDNAAQGVKELLGTEAPIGEAYIGDDRGNDVKFAMNDFYDRPVRSSYYLSLMFDEVQATLFQRHKTIGEGGQISDKLTWISKNSKNKLGTNNAEYNAQRSNLEDSLSTRFGFREDSILGVTQELLDTMPSNGGEARSHVANVIDQTSRVFRDGDVMISRGSAIKYVDKSNGEESGVEYCRVWTKDRPYFSMSDTMKRTANIRKFDDSVLGGTSRVWNINYGPMSDGNKGFESSSNIFDKYQYGGGFFAKKYMFSIENLAWKSSTTEGFTVQDLPYCERGPNGGRVMWFPPYDLKVSEQNSAKWEENTFLGRPEPIYTYQNTSRAGQISFKVVVDHPSVLNLLVREYFKNMSDEESENYINAFFAGCQDVDLYDLVRRFTTLDGDDLKLIQRYLNSGVGSEIISKYKTVTESIKEPVPVTSADPSSGGGVNTSTEVNIDVSLNFINNQPFDNSRGFKTSSPYTTFYQNLSPSFRQKSLNDLGTETLALINAYIANPASPKYQHDNLVLFNNKTPDTSDPTGLVNKVKNDLTTKFNKLDTDFTTYNDELTKLKTEIENGNIKTITFNVFSSTSAIADNRYNLTLSYRRSYSVIYDILNKLSNTGSVADTVLNKLRWDGFDGTNPEIESVTPREVTFKDLGFSTDGSITFKTTNYGEEYNNGDLPCKGNQFVGITGLNIDAPLSFGCRRTEVKLSYTKSDKQPTQDNPNVPVATEVIKPITRIVPDGTITIPSKVQKPPIDVMKRIIMKTLSECYYFKKLEEDSPVAFSSLREKLRYFHPAFHSTTPEGLNTRLTFLNQCVRPGDTMPIKGISDVTDLNARNTTFGPPPICVLRVGDFYNSKVIIRDVNISFEDSTWDLNPEGIGVQPMIATVQLQVNFIGGHGLSKPVERLQNALSSNFYANTEMFDERSITTNKTIDGIDAEKYTKEFLEKIQKNPETTPIKSSDVNDKIIVINGTYLGKLNTTGLTYNTLIENVFEKTTNYFNTYKKTYNDSLEKYGPEITSLLFSNNYRPINDYVVYQGAAGSPQTTVNLIGLFNKSKELNIYVRGLKTIMVDHIENQINSVTKDILNIRIPDSKVPNSDLLLKPYFSNKTQEILDGINDYQPIKDLEKARNELISALDKVNFIVYYLHDAKINGEIYTKATLSGFTYDLLYNKYEKCIDFIESNHSKLTSHINNDVDFNNISTITTGQTVDILSVLLNDETQNIISLYTDKLVFRDNVEIPIITKALNKFFVEPDEVNFKLKKYPELVDNKIVGFTISTETTISDDTEKLNIKKINSSKVASDTNLNYYKP